MKAKSYVTTPQEYAAKYNLRPIVAAHEHAMTENTYRRYLLSTKNRINPSLITRRVSQLLDFIKSNNLEPPDPVFFD